VCMIHNETSTGVLNPLRELVDTVRQNSDALTIVDTVTSLGATEFRFDDWDIDIAVSGSQKGFMLPPGPAFLAASERAMAADHACKRRGCYFNFSESEKSQAALQTPWAPAGTLIRGLNKALDLMMEDGLDTIWKRHELNKQMILAG